MPGIKLLILFVFTYSAIASMALKQATLLLKEGNNQKAISILEDRFNETEDKVEQGEIAYLLSLDPEYKTHKSMSYYIQNALDKNQTLDEKNKARLTRLLADISFETGYLDKALEFYTRALAQKENSNLFDYLTLQKTWVLVNLGKKEEALSLLYNFITTKNSQIIDTMVYDFGRLYVEYLDHRKYNISSFNFKKIPSTKELVSGIFAGISRSETDSKIISPILKRFELYQDFYKFGIETKRISSYNSCSLLSWDLPKNLSKKLVSDISKELIKCSKKTDPKYKSLYTALIKTNIQTNELALLSTSLKDNVNACTQYENLLAVEYSEQWFSFYLSNCLTNQANTTIINYTRKSSNKNYIRTVLENEYYQTTILDSFKVDTNDHIHFLEAVFTKLRIKYNNIDLALLNEHEAQFQKDSIIYCFFYSNKCTHEDTLFTFKYLTYTQQIIYTLDFIKSKNFNAARTLLAFDLNLLNNKFLAKEIYLNAANFKGLYSNSFFKVLSGEKLINEAYISLKEQQVLKNRLTSFWNDTIDTIASMTRTNRRLRYSSTIKTQDQIFRQISKLQKKLSLQKWPNIETRDIVISNYRSLINSAIIGYRKHPTEISSLIESKLKSWKENI